MRRKHTQTAAEKSPSARRLPCRRIREATRGACVRKSVLLTTYLAGTVYELYEGPHWGRLAFTS